ncbi:MAG: hypothetical protein ACK5AN_18090 [Planctomyces sp.]
MSTAVGFAVDRDGFDTHFAAGANDPQGDFAAIGNQNSLKHESQLTPEGSGLSGCGRTGES